MFNSAYDENSISGGLIGLYSIIRTRRHGVSEDEVKLWASDLRALGESRNYFFSLTPVSLPRVQARVTMPANNAFEATRMNPRAPQRER